MNTPRPPLHLCIATGQNLANLIPALQCGAQEVWILQTPRMVPAAGYFADALNQRGIATKRIDFDDEGIEGLNAQAERIAEQLDGKPVVINLSGGTKPMTLALTGTLAKHLATAPEPQRPHLVYTDTEHRRLEWLEPVPFSEPMQEVLKLNDILFAQGFRRADGSGGHAAAEGQRAAADRTRLSALIGKEAHALKGALGSLNFIANNAYREDRQGVLMLSDPVQELPYGPRSDDPFTRVLHKAQEHGMIHWDEGTQVVFRSAEAARYLGGGWVEEFVVAKLRGMDFADTVHGLRIEHVDSRTTNELDAVAVQGNRLLLVECKAARTRHDGEVMDWIYKASQLAQAVGGSHAKALLVSAQGFTEAQVARAKEYRVDALAGNELSRLPEYLRRWKAGGAA
jgi:hypothetical protein